MIEFGIVFGPLMTVRSWQAPARDVSRSASSATVSVTSSLSLLKLLQLSPVFLNASLNDLSSLNASFFGLALCCVGVASIRLYNATASGS